jgi:hypothetical protein
MRESAFYRTPRLASRLRRGSHRELAEARWFD